AARRIAHRIDDRWVAAHGAQRGRRVTAIGRIAATGNEQREREQLHAPIKRARPAPRSRNLQIRFFTLRPPSAQHAVVNLRGERMNPCSTYSASALSPS